jgi:hypothetical protein
MKFSPVRNILVRELRKIGFKGSGSSFVRKSGKSSVFVWIQRSRFAPQFIVNVGAIYSGGLPATGSEADWHVRDRAEEIMPDPPSARAALYEVTPLTEAQRDAALTELIRYADEHLLTPWGDENYLLDLARHESFSDHRPKRTTYPFRKWVARLDGRDESSVKTG